MRARCALEQSNVPVDAADEEVGDTGQGRHDALGERAVPASHDVVSDCRHDVQVVVQESARILRVETKAGQTSLVDGGQYLLKVSLECVVGADCKFCRSLRRDADGESTRLKGRRARIVHIFASVAEIEALLV
jgi:hypothetical protein